MLSPDVVLSGTMAIRDDIKAHVYTQQSTQAINDKTYNHTTGPTYIHTYKMLSLGRGTTDGIMSAMHYSTIIDPSEPLFHQNIN